VPLNPYVIQKKYTQWAKSKGLNPWIVLGRVSHETGMYRFTSDSSRSINKGKEGVNMAK
jgi:HTH-type transcriptional regulator/antitoxin HigA